MNITNFLTILLHNFLYFKIDVSVKSMHVCHRLGAHSGS